MKRRLGQAAITEAAFQLDAVPLQAAVPVAEHVEQREAGAQVLVDHVGAPDLVRAAFAQAEQAGGVVDLAVQQDDGVDAGVAQGSARLHRGKALELGADVRRGVAQHPVHAVVGRAMDDWVRAVARRLPSRKPLQLTQLQFHCGKPPPAAEPRIWMYMAAPSIWKTVENENAPAGRGVGWIA